MGANAINAMAEGLAPVVERITGGRVNLRILSNLADRRLARASFSIPDALLDGGGRNGSDVAEAIVDAYRLADLDPYRAATHNKGAMNGIDAVAIATGNDWRSIEAGAHAFAARSGRSVSSRPVAFESGGPLHLDAEIGKSLSEHRLHLGLRSEEHKRELRCRQSKLTKCPPDHGFACVNLEIDSRQSPRHEIVGYPQATQGLHSPSVNGQCGGPVPRPGELVHHTHPGSKQRGL
jgi:hypothetical protein